jgi:hypothetical protein
MNITDLPKDILIKLYCELSKDHRQQIIDELYPNFSKMKKLNRLVLGLYEMHIQKCDFPLCEKFYVQLYDNEQNDEVDTFAYSDLNMMKSITMCNRKGEFVNRTQHNTYTKGTYNVSYEELHALHSKKDLQRMKNTKYYATWRTKILNETGFYCHECELWSCCEHYSMYKRDDDFSCINCHKNEIHDENDDDFCVTMMKMMSE